MKGLALLSLAFVLALPSPPVAAQRAADAGLRYDFGSVAQGQIVEHEFAVANAGAAPAQIARVEFDTPGLTARFKPLVAPGGSTTVRVSWNTSQVEGDAQVAGTLIWATPGRPSLAIALHANVVPPIEILPLPAVFFSVFTDESAEHDVEIVNHDAAPLRLLGVEPQGTHFSAALDTVEPGRRFKLRVRVPAGAAPGRYMEHVAVRTDSARRPMLSIPVNVLIKADVYANPDSLDFGQIPLATLRRSPHAVELLTQTVLVKRRQGPFRITRATCDVPALVVSAGATAATVQQITVAFAPDRAAAGPFKGEIHLATTDAKFPDVRISVRGEVR